MDSERARQLLARERARIEEAIAAIQSEGPLPAVHHPVHHRTGTQCITCIPEVTCLQGFGSATGFLIFEPVTFSFVDRSGVPAGAERSTRKATSQGRSQHPGATIGFEKICVSGRVMTVRERPGRCGRRCGRGTYSAWPPSVVEDCWRHRDDPGVSASRLVQGPGRQHPRPVPT
jgi:hypothetical protein